MKVLFEEHIAIRRLPINFKEKDRGLFEHELEKRISKSYSIELSNVFLLNNILFKPWNLSKYFKYYMARRESNFQIFVKFFLLWRRWKSIPEGLWFLDNRSANYFHWFSDSLTRLLIHAQSEQIPAVIPNEYYQIPFVRESLNALGFKVVITGSKRAYKFDKLIMASYTAKPGNFNKELLNELRSKLAVNTSLKPLRKVYISRSRALKRKINNEAEVIMMFKHFGYEIHHFEEYSWADQLKIMSNTQILAGLHGAGLTNMLFMPEGSKILEIRNANDNHNNCYFSMASALDHHYFYQLSKSENPNVKKNADVSVDLAQLKKNLELIVLKN
ncbi:MAG: hypothetical protein CMP48_07685 [Rickettsiales bacterium]|nr:hypothetical protein [Rickettsiales bacterium]